MLYVVPTPIGNLKDISQQCLDILAEVEFILAEDTRTSGKLLKHYQISTPARSYHIHNEHKIVDDLVEQAKIKDIALISDAGTPGISDPGFLIIRACIAEGVEVMTIPGPTAFVPALVSSGLPMDKFYFEGFLPTKKGRQTRLKYLAQLDCTFILYESPHRIPRCIKELMEYCGEQRQASVAREISKLHEEHIRGTLEEIAQKLDEKSSIKGEIVVCVHGNG